ncbi:hypothetical protein [Nannocystis pusilla]|uniref:hypothetical protein n=1 Tax=Nannocystis pusilla TaxID=889268 RepID=UPI003B7F700C
MTALNTSNLLDALIIRWKAGLPPALLRRMNYYESARRRWMYLELHRVLKGDSWSIRAEEARGRPITASTALASPWKSSRRSPRRRRSSVASTSEAEASPSPARPGRGIHGPCRRLRPGGGGKTDTSTEEERRQDRSTGHAVEHVRANRLRAAAEKLHRDAEAKLAQTRRVNTPKRAREAASADAAARYDQVVADSMQRIAVVLEDGSAPHLIGVGARTHVELLRKLLRSSLTHQEEQAGRRVEESDIEKVRYPYPDPYPEYYTRELLKLRELPGLKQLASKFLRIFSAVDQNRGYIITDPQMIRELEQLGKRPCRTIAGSRLASATRSPNTTACRAWASTRRRNSTQSFESSSVAVTGPSARRTR